MIGGTLKVAGLLLIVVGVLGILAGLAGAAYGYIDEDDNQEGLLSDPERSDQNEALMTYGLVSAGIGLVMLVVGIILAVAGGSVSRAGDRGAATGPKRAWLGAFVILLVVAGVAAGVAWTGDRSALVSPPGGDADQSRLLDESAFSGIVQHAFATPIESGTIDASQSTQTFVAPAGTQRIEVNTTWTPQQGGASELRMILEIQEGDAWRELDRAGGQSALVFELKGPELDGATLRYRVFADADAAVVLEQEFGVEVRFYGTREA